MDKRAIFSSIIKGVGATLILISAYFIMVSLISGFVFAESQFAQFWYYLVSLAVGFGIQIGLYSYLKASVHAKDPSGRVLAVTGTTSTGAMISCCAHYLVNILPVLGVSAFASFVGDYQVQLFWIGTAFNLAGIVFILSRILKFKQHHKKI